MPNQVEPSRTSWDRTVRAESSRFEFKLLIVHYFEPGERVELNRAESNILMNSVISFYSEIRFNKILSMWSFLWKYVWNVLSPLFFFKSWIEPSRVEPILLSRVGSKTAFSILISSLQLAYNRYMTPIQSYWIDIHFAAAAVTILDYGSLNLWTLFSAYAFSHTRHLGFLGSLVFLL